MYVCASVIHFLVKKNVNFKLAFTFLSVCIITPRNFTFLVNLVGKFIHGPYFSSLMFNSKNVRLFRKRVLKLLVTCALGD